MKHLLNTLYVTTPDAYLSRDGETVLVRVNDDVKLRLPVHTLTAILCFGHTMCTPALMGLCAEHQVHLAFFSEHGRFICRSQGPVSGNVLLRRQQYRVADDPCLSSRIAACCIVGKIANSRIVLQRAARETSGSESCVALGEAVLAIGRLIPQVETLESLGQIRGREGEAGRMYFSVFDHMITADKENFFLRERTRRPPLDNVNALLSFIYTLLVSDVTAALEGVGLDPAVGFLHRDRPGRPSLALDLMEELRPVLADRLALSLINRHQVSASGFRKTDSGGVIMDDDTRKEVLVAWQKRKQEEVQHPFLGEKAPIGLLPHLQALLLARHLRGGLDAYPALIWK